MSFVFEDGSKYISASCFIVLKPKIIYTVLSFSIFIIHVKCCSNQYHTHKFIHHFVVTE